MPQWLAWAWAGVFEAAEPRLELSAYQPATEQRHIHTRVNTVQELHQQRV